MSGNTSNHYIDDTNTLDNGKVKWIPGKADPSGNINNRLKASDVANEASLNYTDTFSGTVTALGTTSAGACNALGLPFDTLTFTASGAVNQVDVHVHFTVGMGVIVIENLNGDTIDISASTNGNSFVPLLRNSAGTIIAATDANLTAVGVYYLYLGD
jgi:hypothetical protein